MNGYYLYYGSYSDGVNRKIDMQIKEFSKFAIMEKIAIEKIQMSRMEKALTALPWNELRYNFDRILRQIKSPGFIYIRKATVDKGLIRFLQAIKQQYSNCKIIMEIPVYPYFRDTYCNNTKHFIRMFPLFIKDYSNRGKLKGLVDRFATFEMMDKIYGIKTLHIYNGINVDDIKPNAPQIIRNQNLVQIIAVAMLSPHHGYERIIHGMHVYYTNGGTKDIQLKIVGYGNQLDYYKRLVTEYKLENHVVFCGRKSGEELDALYNHADMAVVSLGLYKKKLHIGSFIKTGEYLSKGLPIISGSPVDVLDSEAFPFFIQFPNDASPIDMNRVLDFYARISTQYTKAELIAAIRKYAYETVNMDIALNEISEYVNG